MGILTDAKRKMNEGGALAGNQIVVLVIAIYLIGALLPDAISTIFNASTVGWSATGIALWGVLPILILAAIYVKLTE